MMRLLDFFRRRPDGRCEPDTYDLDARLAARKAIRNEPNPHKRGHMTRALDAQVRG